MDKEFKEKLKQLAFDLNEACEERVFVSSCDSCPVYIPYLKACLLDHFSCDKDVDNIEFLLNENNEDCRDMEDTL